jgi:ferritin-like metal-binding protein YciE
MSIKTVQDLFLSELRDTYHAEKQAVKAMPKMAKAASHPELKQVFEQHLEETRGQVERLEQVFDLLDVPKRGKPCHAMEGLVEEAREQIGEIEDKAVLDVAIIVAAQKMEHYEIAAYGSLATLAKQLGHDEAARLLGQTLDEEKAADQKLNQVALGVANQDAAKASGGGKQKAGKAS